MTAIRTCPDCDGEGITECTACASRHYKRSPFGCMVCGNTHDVSCPNCNGSGYEAFSLKSEHSTETEIP